MKKTAWQWFSKYIRLRDCLKTTGNPEIGRCVTCGNIKLFTELQAGHGIGGRSNSILFDEELVNAQCVYCNYHKKGNYENYIEVLIDRHGREWYDKKKYISKQPCKLDFKVISDYYRKEYKKLKDSIK